MKIFAALASAFQKEQVDTCFALLGDANMYWAGALSDLGVRFVYTRHEHAAVAGATTYARASGKVGVASVTCGPGLTQVMTIIPIAVRARVPLVIFAGEAPLYKPWYNQNINQAPFVEACGAEYRALHDPETMIADVHQAFADAKGTQKPIVVGVPLDVQQQIYDGQQNQPSSFDLFTPGLPIVPDQSDIAHAAQWIEKARRPVLLAGLGAVAAHAKEACVALAEKSGACLATTLPAKGFFHDQSFCLGVAGGYGTEAAKAIFAETDLVIGVGARLASHTFDSGRLTPNARVIQLDVNPNEVVQGRKAADMTIAADARLGCEALCNVVGMQQGWRTESMKSRTEAALMLPDEHQTPDGALHPMAVVKALAEVVPHNCHIVNTSGHIAYYTAQMNSHPQSHYTVIRDFGAIGNGTSFAMGIAAAHPERPVILLDGDGSALMHIQELETMHRHGMHILTIVLNDGAYGSEVHKLRADGVTEAGSVFGRPDFAAIGRGFGIDGLTFKSLENMTQAMDAFLLTGTSAIWDIQVSDQITSPQILKAHNATQQH